MSDAEKAKLFVNTLLHRLLVVQVAKGEAARDLVEIICTAILERSQALPECPGVVRGALSEHERDELVLGDAPREAKWRFEAGRQDHERQDRVSAADEELYPPEWVLQDTGGQSSSPRHCRHDTSSKGAAVACTLDSGYSGLRGSLSIGERTASLGRSVAPRPCTLKESGVGERCCSLCGLGPGSKRVRVSKTQEHRAVVHPKVLSLVNVPAFLG